MNEDYRGPVEHSIEMSVERIASLLEGEYYVSARSLAVLLLQEDEEIDGLIRKKEDPDVYEEISSIVQNTISSYSNPLSYEIAMERQKDVQDIARRAVRTRSSAGSFAEKLSRVTMNPITGIPILLFILYWGVYKFVGVFGAGTVVDFLEGVVFEEHVNPVIIHFTQKAIPWELGRSLIAGEYGMLTMGFRYAIAIILPIVTFFFLVFSLIEDSGYLPRLAMLIDRTFKKIGLSGRAVIPMVLGFGCDTMATMVTRTLPTKRERVISTMLLALAVPCSAQLGVILALLEGRPGAMLVWAGVIGLVFLLIGYLTAKVLPGVKPSFYMELPPLRMPKITNIISKTYVRVKWYLKEVIPMFILASFMIWLGELSGLFSIAVRALRYPVQWIGLPTETSKVFLFGFFRRDYGAAGLYDISKTGALTGVQLVVACIALTLFLPCIAQFLMNIKERGWKTGLGISFFTLVFSFGVAWAVNTVLVLLGASL